MSPAVLVDMMVAAEINKQTNPKKIISKTRVTAAEGGGTNTVYGEKGVGAGEFKRLLPLYRYHLLTTDSLLGVIHVLFIL